ncbi:dirigent protein 1-like [Salvia hispanica]|uniref:dirigent protein 1-like n=1 Tax=Salvia hispanica TaxID=49212 RepID=UPI002009C0BC|nr:dirigent protein 1-like [Salvia hispanica]
MARAPLFSLIILLSLAISLPTNSKREMRRSSERLTHLHLYSYEAARGDATAVVVAQAATTNTYRYRLGEVVVIDNRLAEGPNLSSRAVGRSQGMYAAVDVSNSAFLSVFNLVFTEGEFKGSTLSMMGRYDAQSGEREFPIVGGNGVFRSARGYARMRTYSDDMETGISVDEYHVYVIHS